MRVEQGSISLLQKLGAMSRFLSIQIKLSGIQRQNSLGTAEKYRRLLKSIYHKTLYNYCKFTASAQLAGPSKLCIELWRKKILSLVHFNLKIFFDFHLFAHLFELEKNEYKNFECQNEKQTLLSQLRLTVCSTETLPLLAGIPFQLEPKYYYSGNEKSLTAPDLK